MLTLLYDTGVVTDTGFGSETSPRVNLGKSVSDLSETS